MSEERKNTTKNRLTIRFLSFFLRYGRTIISSFKAKRIPLSLSFYCLHQWVREDIIEKKNRKKTKTMDTHCDEHAFFFIFFFFMPRKKSRGFSLHSSILVSDNARSVWHCRFLRFLFGKAMTRVRETGVWIESIHFFFFA